MTDKQIILIKSSWKIFRGIAPELIGEVFYSRLFIMMPMFNNSMEEQYKKLIEMLSYIVARLDKIEEVIEPAKELAIRHVDYGVRPGHYKLVGSALLWTLEKGLGKDWNDEMKGAWTECYTVLSDTMIAAAYGDDEKNS